MSRTYTFGRRSFLERLGLGAGAALLSPVAGALVGEARGASAARKRIVFFVHGNGLNYQHLTPPELRRGSDTTYPVLDGPTAYTWPAMLRRLERFRSKMLLIDGLANSPKSGASQHGTGFSALSGFAAAHGGSNEGGGKPGGITIDQHIANAIGATTRAKSVLFGASSNASAVYARAFASGVEKPEPHFQNPRLMFADLFGAVATDASGFNRGAFKQGLLIDGMRADVKRLEGALAGSERRKLEHYLAAVDEFGKRMKASQALACPAPEAPQAVATVEDRLEAMTEMATVALVCGMTNVVGISVGTGNSHTDFPKYGRIHAGSRFEAEGGVHSHGHSPPDVAAAAWELIHDFNATLIARMADALAKIPEGNGTALDNTAFVYLSDNGGEHHSKHERFPLFILGDLGKRLKTGGRYLRYPKRRTAGARALADLWSTLATACGVPTDDFGKGGNEPVSGPLSEILV
jgi:hypothetical protein